MSLRILHCGDLHIGMKFNSYPEELRPVSYTHLHSNFSVLQIEIIVCIYPNRVLRKAIQ